VRNINYEITCVQWVSGSSKGTTSLPKDGFIVTIGNKAGSERLNRRDEGNDFFIEKLFELGFIKRVTLV